MKRVDGKKGESRAAQGPVTSYIAMHDSKLAQCLASGFLSPWPRGAEVLDHHSRAGRLVFEVSGVSQQAMAGARAGLDFGRVAIIEVDPEIPFGIALATGPSPALPLSSVVRVCFDSPDALEEFEARVSGFGDIEPGVVRLHVEPAVFPDDAGSEAQSDWVSVESEDAGATDFKDSLAPNDAGKRIQWLDRTAGSLAAAVAALPFSGRAELVKELANVPGSCGPIDEGPSVPSAVAALVDHGRESGTTAPVILAVQRAISELSPGGSLDPGEIVDHVRRDLEEVGAELAPLVSRFLDMAREIIAARRELPPNAFSDEGGSITLRALLLFLIQPDADRLSAVWHQAENLGPRVFCLYSSLVGFYSGFSGLPVDIKGGVARTLAVPELALGAMAREPLRLEVRTNWDALDGSESVALEWRDKELCRVHVAANALLGSYANVARSCGYEASFNSETGELSIKADIDGVSRAAKVVLRDSLPVFPRCQGLELIMQVGVRVAKRALKEQLELVNEAALDSGIFANGVLVGRTSAIVLHAFVMPPPSPDAVKGVLRSLVATCTRLEKQSPMKKRKAKQLPQGNAS